MMKQVIAFIAPDKFAGLLGNYVDCIGFRTYTEQGDPRLLNGGNHVFYVYEPGEFESECFDQDKAENAVFILVPDALRGFDDYEPNREFAILYHNETPNHRELGFWRARPFFCGSKLLMEHPTTAYGVIARQMIDGVPDPDAIWDTLTAEYMSLRQE